MAMAKTFLLTAMLALCGCASQREEPPDYWGQERNFRLGASIDYSSRPSDWPELTIDVQTLPPATVEKMCEGAEVVPVGFRRAGCAMPYFCQRRCTIWLADYTLRKHTADLLLQHERAHCRGYDHPGSTRTRDAWERAKANGCGPGVLSPPL